jgi:hypothetical protein
MSSFKSIFIYNDHEYEVVSCNYSLHQSTDQGGRPTSEVHSAGIHLEIVATENVDILEWMIDPFKKANGSICF